jgi:hypothetical protein
VLLTVTATVIIEDIRPAGGPPHYRKDGTTG